MSMKYVKPAVVAATAFTMSTAPVMAGGMAEPVMEPEIIVEESTGTGGGWVVPLVLIAVIAAVASSSGSSPAPSPGPIVEN